MKEALKTKDIQDWLVAQLSRLLETEPEKLDVHQSFSYHGLSSKDAVRLSGELEDFLGRRLSPTLAYEYPNIAALSQHLGENKVSGEQKEIAASAARSNEPVAIVGMSCRFPGAKDPRAYWQMLKEGKDQIREVPADRWPRDSYYDPDPAKPGKAVSYWGGFLDDIDQFDPFFFGISPVEAKHMDPQQRLLMELSYEALDDAGFEKEDLSGSRTGVFVGVSVNEYSHRQLNNPAAVTSHSGTGSALSISANRISYFYNLRGPSMAIDTACSSSLTAIHLACQSLKNGESSLALAGGVNLILSPAHSIAFTKAGVLAPDGRCKTFDADANGYVRGEGGGMIVLKRLSEALEDGDHIHGVIEGSTMSQDGRTNGLMAPSQDSQEAMLRQAYRDAGIAPEMVQYVEAHGTGTLLGDAMEAAALGEVLGAARKGNPCAIGSVKTNMGHLEAAAGIAGLMKVVLAMGHKVLPPSLHFASPNPHVDFERLNLKVQSELSDWPETSGPAMAGVSSFGFGGTNVHMILSKGATEEPNKSTKERMLLLPLSAGSEETLLLQAQSFQSLLAADSSEDLEDLCYMAGLKRAGSKHRLVVTGNSRKELSAGLVAYLNKEQHPGVISGQSEHPPKTAFIFSGQGGQWLGMGRDLLGKEPLFYETINRIDKEIQTHFNWSLLAELLAEESTAKLNEVEVVQPAIFAIQVGLFTLWESWGIRPDGVAGHSMGEVAAAWAAGILTLEDAIQVICVRSRELQKLKGKGAMLATELTETQTSEYLEGYESEVAVAAVNGPVSTVLSGSPDSLTEIMKRLEAENLFCRWIKVDVASHSPQIDKIAHEVSGQLNMLSPQPAAIPFYSTVTGQISLGLEMDGDYWVQNLRRPVQLSGAVNQLLEAGFDAFVELGPHPILLSSIQQSVERREAITLTPSMEREAEAGRVMLTSLAKLYVQGAAVNWEQLYPGLHEYVSLPPGPWQRDRYWLETAGSHAGNSWHPGPSGHLGKHSLLGEKIDLAHSPASHIWQNYISLDQLTYLQDHRVGGKVVFPGTGYLEVAFQAMEELGIGQSHAVSGFNFQKIMTLTEGSAKSLQTQVSSDESGNYRLSIYSKQSEKDRWKQHVSASLVKHPVSEPSVISLPKAEGDELSADILYQAFGERGIQYGPDFQGIRQLVRDGDKVWGRISLPDAVANERGHYQWHPALLDACLQVLGGLVQERGIKGLYVPSGCDSIQLYAPGAEEVWSRVSLRPSDTGSNKGLVADIHVFDKEGQSLITLTGFRLKSFERGKSDQLRKDTWLYQPKWRVKNLSSSPSLPDNGTRKHWLVLADDGGLGDELSKKLIAQGDTCQLLPVPSYESEEELIGEIENGLNAAPSAIYGIVHLWSLSVTSRLSAKREPEEMVYSLGVDSTLCLVKAIAKRFAGSPRLWLVTKGAQAVNDEDQVALEQSALWGLGKVISFELPEIKCVRLDLDTRKSDATALSQLSEQLAIDDDDDQIAFRGSDRYVMRLRPFKVASHSLPDFSLSTEATYLITGGLGALGLTTAQWMADQGAGNFVLLGRSEPSSEASLVVEKMLEQGANVIVAQADIADRDQVQEIFEKIKAHMPPLKGVIHAAGLLDDGSLLNLNRERLQLVMAPKVNGTWYLHEATADLDLDFFVLYSSAVSVLGSPGQGNYAAASAYLDAMAWYRQSLGLPAQSINWGPWAEIGLAAETAERLKEQNASTQHLVKEIKIDQGLAVLEQLMKESAAQVVVLPFDLKNLLELYPTAAGMSFFAEVGGNETHLKKLYARPKLEQAYVPPRTDVERKLTELWEQTLHIDKVGIQDSFFELGGDSVLAAQILSLVRKTYGISISPQEAFKAFTIEQLAQQLEAEIMRQIESMTDEEAERLLGQQNQ